MTSSFPTLNAHWISDCLGLSSTPANPTFTRIVTDSRKITPGCLFVALAGDTFDGHDFILKALDQGAAGVVGREDSRQMVEAHAAHPGACLFTVEDSLNAYRALGERWRTHFKGPLIMVAGSAGKTTTKELLTSILRGRFPQVLKTIGSQNGFVGIPMTLLELNSTHEAAVIEVGIDEVGAMEQHFRIVRPDVVVLTAIGPEHLEKLKDLETVAHEEGIAFRMAIDSGSTKLAVNLDDPLIAPWFEKAPANRRLGYSLSQAKLSADQTAIEVLKTSFALPLPGRHNATNLLAAISCAQLLGLSAEEMKKGLTSFVGAEGRSQLRELPCGKERLHVLCDYYNSQPASVAAALELISDLSKTHAPGRPRFACLGDMLELGPDEERYHREIAGALMHAGVENALLFGPRMKWLEDELKLRGFSGTVAHFEKREELADKLLSMARPPSLILIKGSRGMKMEEVWQRLEVRCAPKS